MRNPNAKHIDYGFLQGEIPDNPNFMPSNIDGIIERNGSFMVLEWKRRNEKISKGQERLLKALAQNNITVAIICGDTDNGLNFEHCWLLNNKGEPEVKYTKYEEKFITLDEVAYEAAVLLSASVPITIEEQIPVFTGWVDGALSESILSRKKNYLKKHLR